jgi:hypothetical protein
MKTDEPGPKQLSPARFLNGRHEFYRLFFQQLREIQRIADLPKNNKSRYHK